MSAATELVVIERSSALTVFTDPDQIDPVLKRIADEARALVPDVTTAKGRAEIKSVAYRVAQSKTYLDNLGKDLVAEYKELPRKIDATRKMARDFLDALRDEVRAPLDAWEAEQARIEAERLAAEEAERLRVQIEHDHELALLMNAQIDAERAEKARVAAAQQAERDRQIAAEAEARARQEAEQRVIDARLAAERAEQARQDAEARAERERAEAAELAKRAAAEAVERERRRAEEEQRRQAEEQAKRDADMAHRKAVNRAALAAFIQHGLSEEQGKLAVTAIVNGAIPNVKIQY